MVKSFTFRPMTFDSRSGLAFAMVLMAPFFLGQAWSQEQPVAPNNSSSSAPTTSQGQTSSSQSKAARTQGDNASTTSQGASSSLGAANGDYVLKPGDTLDMVIYHEPDLSMRAKIGKDSMVQLPLLGEVKLGGLTVRSATSLLREKYNADYLVNPQLYLDIAGYNASKFTIIGQVGRPGTYDCGGSETIGMLEAIGMAGGFTRIADRGHIIVKRRDGDSLKTIKVNAKKLSDVGADRFEIQPGDVIDVHESWF